MAFKEIEKKLKNDVNNGLNVENKINNELTHLPLIRSTRQQMNVTPVQYVFQSLANPNLSYDQETEKLEKEISVKKTELFEINENIESLKEALIVKEALIEIEQVCGMSEDKETLENIETQRQIIKSLQSTADNLKTEIKQLDEIIFKKRNSVLQNLAIEREIEIAKQRVKEQDRLAILHKERLVSLDWEKVANKNFEQIQKYKKDVTESKIFFNVTGRELDDFVDLMNTCGNGPYRNSINSSLPAKWQNLPYFIRYSASTQDFVIVTFYYSYSIDNSIPPKLQIMEGLFRIQESGFKSGALDENGHFDPDDNPTCSTLNELIAAETDVVTIYGRIEIDTTQVHKGIYKMSEKDNFILVKELAGMRGEAPISLAQYISNFSQKLQPKLKEPKKVEKTEAQKYKVEQVNIEQAKSKESNFDQSFQNALIQFSSDLQELNLDSSLNLSLDDNIYTEMDSFNISTVNKKQNHIPKK